MKTRLILGGVALMLIGTAVVVPPTASAHECESEIWIIACGSCAGGNHDHGYWKAGIKLSGCTSGDSTNPVGGGILP